MEHVSTPIKTICYHCGEDCATDSWQKEEKTFCCQGCLAVYDLLESNDLCGYYDLEQNKGVSLKAKSFEGRFDFLKNTSIADSLLTFSSETQASITLYIPSIHCSSCVWLLENMPKIQEGVYHSRLNFPEKKLTIQFDPRRVSVFTLVTLLTTLGYEPVLQENSVQKGNKKQDRKLLTQIAVVGFCLGNSMLLSFPEYFKIDHSSAQDSFLQAFFLYLNFGLALPVYFYGAQDYLVGAWKGILALLKKQTQSVSVDIPIALGISALFFRSLYETFAHGTAGYWDSLAGLVFFLLVGKWVQQKTYAFLTFKRDHTSYFPLAVERINNDLTTYVSIKDLEINDRILVRPQALIPVDSEVIQGTAWIDYSFVTGESLPVTKRIGEKIYAGGRQLGQTVELKVLKTVDQSYLTQLWNNATFQKEKAHPPTVLAEAFSKYFTLLTLFIATSTGIYWGFVDSALVWPTVTAVLMVACPCALTLALPFAMNTSLGILGQNKFYVKNQHVLQKLTEVTAFVFDKTGTLTSSQKAHVSYQGKELTTDISQMILGITEQSSHPLSKAIATHLREEANVPALSPESSKEVPGFGIEGWCKNIHVQVGQAEWIARNFEDTNSSTEIGSRVYIGIDGSIIGYFSIQPRFRANWEVVLTALQKTVKTILLSGDDKRQEEIIAPYFAKENRFFHQKPIDKLSFIQRKQAEGEMICMIGDGLNDTGALQQSNVGIAISEEVHVFTPAADALLDASSWEKLPVFLAFAKDTVQVVKISFLFSLVYNIIGISWAVTGTLSPVIAAIFMPLSSLSVVLIAVGLTYWKARIYRLNT